ncbi:YCF48-related protein [Plasticicumulans acidivorans]|uniref:Photosystem II stability/assembly factor-like uncharacterized protein n=1 Tax=Plasticicumulans acidivorans TaxID=886464 RepID=A0A317MYL0_9GAMM|nr:YCF48-related protein [Plasticicumulans acidivorans]PWV64614.1 photosystem II stability/assembly factor-like uncharacterized protein [Plasticicumulans acidivorans]
MAKSATASLSRRRPAAFALRSARGLSLLGGALLLLVSTVLALRQPPRLDAWQPPASLLSVDGWSAPREYNAFMRQPLLGADIVDVQLAGTGVWLLSAAGEILYSADGGIVWQRQWAEAELPMAAESAAGAMTAAAASFDKALAGIAPPVEAPSNTNNSAFKPVQPSPVQQQAPAAQQQQQQQPPIVEPPRTGPPLPLNALYFLANGRDGWAVGADGRLLSTADGGQHWQAQRIAAGATLYGVYFVDAVHGWIVGENGLQLSTTDGGRSWQEPAPTRALPPPTLYAVYFLDAARGWAVGEAGSILSSRDGGQSWQPQASGSRASLGAIHVAADGRGWASGADGTLLLTGDGGVSWRPAAAPARMQAVDFAADGQYGVAAGALGLSVSRDGGTSWQALAQARGLAFEQVRMTADAQRIWAAGPRGTLLASVDGGAHWYRPVRGGAQWLARLQFSAAQAPAWATAAGGRLALSDDGERWQPRQPLAVAGLSLLDLQFAADGRHGWAVGVADGSSDGYAGDTQGVVLASVDGGERWQLQNSGTPRRLRAVAFAADARHGWVVGDRGTILASSDGGTHWQAQSSGSGRDLWAVCAAADGVQALAVGDGGSVLASVDGRQWRAQASGSIQPLNALHCADDLRRAWAVGERGTLLVSRDGGQLWQTQPSGVDVALYGVSFAADGRRGWAVGAEGTLLATSDGGERWQRLPRLSAQNLLDVQASADGRSVRVVGNGPTLLASDDGGRSWRGGELNPEAAARDWPRYQRDPAPWMALAWAAGIGLLLLAVRKPRAEYAAQPSVADAPASDKPLEPGEPDALAFAPLARGLAFFMRNEHTRPPLTLAITGNWGTGKSSLMNLLRGELERHGVRAVWFNAWHHQKEEHLLAALIDGIRRQAIPPSWSLDGLRFRWRLLMIRSGRRWPWALLVLLLACWSGGYFLKDFPLRFERAWALTQTLTTQFTAALTSGEAGDKRSNISALPAAANAVADETEKTSEARPQATTGSAGGLARGLAALAAALAAGSGLLKAVRAFGVKPEVLLASLSDKTSVRDLGAQTSFRYRYQQEFAEVTRALEPRTMLILIDDLDRCQPDHVLEVLEAVNFLVSSGDCFIVLGIDKEKVQGALGIAFKELAQEMADQAASVRGEPLSDEERARAKRERYARDYLEKLINIEVPVPLLDPADPPRSRGMLAGGEHAPAGEQRLHGWQRRLHGLASVLLGGSLVVAAAGGGFYLAGITPEPPADLALLAVAVPPSPGAQAGVEPAAPLPALAGPQRATAVAAPGQAAERPLLSSGVGVALLIALALLAVRLRRPDIVVRDSQHFADALDIWLPYLLTVRRPTPRALKRYQNRVRYVAMRQRPLDGDAGPFDRLLRRLLGVAPAAHTDEAPLSEALLVALGARQLVEPEALLDEAGSRGGRLDDAHATPAQQAALDVAVARHRERFGADSWPPSAAQLRRFLALSEGIAIR